MDIDIDMKTSFSPLTIFPSSVLASMVKDGSLLKHPCGTYFQTMPIDEVTGYAAIPFNEAEQMGFMKIDFLHLSLLDDVTSKDELRNLAFQQPDWSLLEDSNVVSKLFHISNHYDLVNKVKPTSVQELADCIALIRPGKRQLLDEYLADKDFTREELYQKTNFGYYFKRSHAISYALNIVVQLNKLRRTNK